MWEWLRGGKDWGCVGGGGWVYILVWWMSPSPSKLSPITQTAAFKGMSVWYHQGVWKDCICSIRVWSAKHCHGIHKYTIFHKLDKSIPLLSSPEGLAVKRVSHVAVPCRIWRLYSVAYFDRIAVFEAPYHWTSVKGGAHTCFVDAWRIYKVPLSPAFNGSSAIRSNYATE